MDIKAVFEQLISLYEDLSKKQKIVTISSLVVLLSFLSFIVLYDFSPNEKGTASYKVLFKDLPPEDVSQIIEELKKSDVPYKLEDETTILIPKKDLYEQRIKISSLDIIKKDGIGFELFDKREFGETDFDQTIKYLRAIEGELSRTIESLAPVEKATVHLAIPKETVFIAKAIEPTASVVVKLKPETKIGIRQVQGIKNLIASSISRLSVDNVKVIDDSGQTLGDDDEIGMADELAKTQLNYKKKYERNYEDKIIDILAPFIGGRNSISAKVTIDFDFTRRDATKEAYDPNNVIRSEQSLEEKREGFRPKDIGGIPGAVSNIGPVKGLDDEGEPTETYSKTKSTTNYEISKMISNVKSEFAKINRITVAVVVDGTYIKEYNESEGVETYTYEALPDDKLAKLEEIVKRTVGFQEDRKDEVTVSNFQFTYATLPKIQTKYEKFLNLIEPYTGLGKYIVASILFFIFYKFVISPFAVRMLEVEVQDKDKKASMLKLDEIANFDSDADKLGDIKRKVENSLDLDGNINEEAVKYDVLFKKIQDIIEENPEESAKILSAFIKPELKNNISLEG
jgi:flagellar M-ring protein FliF